MGVSFLEEIRSTTTQKAKNKLGIYLESQRPSASASRSGPVSIVSPRPALSKVHGMSAQSWSLTGRPPDLFQSWRHRIPVRTTSGAGPKVGRMRTIRRAQGFIF